MHNRQLYYLSGLRDKYKTLLGTDVYATPGLTYAKYGFDTECDKMCHYVVIYSPIVFCDKAKQEFARYLEFGVKHKEKQLSSIVSKRFANYFKLILTEKSNGIEEILDVMDAMQIKWDEYLSNMHLQIYNRAYKYIKDDLLTRKFASLVTSYAYLDMGSAMCEVYLSIKNDGEYVLIQQAMAHLINTLFRHLSGFKQLFAEIKDLYSTATMVVYKQLKAVADSYGND